MFNFQIDSQEENFCLLEYLSSSVNMYFPSYLSWRIWIHFSHEESVKTYYFYLTIIFEQSVAPTFWNSANDIGVEGKLKS